MPEPIEMNDPEKINQLLMKIALTGKGFITECLLAEVIEVGITYPDHLKASGEDPEASYDGKSPAWAVYHVRQGKKVFMVYGGGGKERRTQITETP